MTCDTPSPATGGGRHAPVISARVEGFDGHRRLLWPAVVGLAAAAALAVAGLPPADLHGPLHRLGIMDPLCGGTRALRAVAQGQLGTAWRYNPLSVVLFVGAIAVIFRIAVGTSSGRWLNVRIGPPRTIAALTILLIAVLEANQQLHASLLMRSAIQTVSPWGGPPIG